MTSRPAPPLISVVIANYNGAAYLEICLRSLLKQTHTRTEIVLVDNASADNSIEIVRRTAPQAAVLSQARNLGFAGGINAGVRAARGYWIAVLNNDTEAASDWLSECMAAAERHPDAAFLAPRIMQFHERGRVYSAGDCFLRSGIGYRRGQEQPDREDYHKEGVIFSACGCAALFRRDVLEMTGGYDELFFAYLEDVDLGLRLQAAGSRGYYVPRAVIYHMGGMTGGGEFSPLAVRLRTRNSILLLAKSLPARILLRCIPMILASQLVWFARVLVHKQLWSYLCGLGAIFRLLPTTLAERAKLRQLWRSRSRSLWQAILESESVARKDVADSSGERASWFLRWYFRTF